MATDDPIDPIGPVAARFSEDWIEVRPGVALRVLRWQPELDQGLDPVVFVAGWVSLVSGWLELLRVLTPRRPILYIETREKHTARLAAKHLVPEGFSIPTLADDLIEVCRILEVQTSRAILFGSSMGSNAILEALKEDRLKAGGAFLIGPNATFHFPWWAPALLYLPRFSHRPAKRIVVWYLRNFRVNAREDPAQMQRYERTVAAADPLRLKLSAFAVREYSVWPDLETINTPVAIAYAPSDTLHGEREVEEMASRIPRGWTIACPSNTYMHTAALKQELEGFIGEALGETSLGR